MISPKIINQDKDILVLDKPAGLVVNRSETTKGETIQDWLADFWFKNRFKNKQKKAVAEKFKDFWARHGLVHRLDKDTSGVLLAAKTPEAFSFLQQQFKQRKVAKKYLALVHGKVSLKKGSINAPISRSPFNRKKFGIFLGGREARTDYQVQAYYCSSEGKFFSLLEVNPLTGRTHQIRVHFKYLNHPLVADKTYGGRKLVRADNKWCSRQFLHASQLCFQHPEKRKRVCYFSPLPEDLKKALKQLKKQ